MMPDVASIHRIEVLSVTSATHQRFRRFGAAVVSALVASSLVLGFGVGVPVGNVLAMAPDHLVISEVVTGGASASDELIELYNPTAVPLPLEGLEVVYASASGLTVTRRAAWEIGAPGVPPGHHVLIANEAGIYASIADAVYTSGMAATGGSVALRIVGASSAIDAVGWGTATGTWLEGNPAAVPAAGASIERLPGGALGSTQDTDDNAADFTSRSLPDPQNAASPPTPDPTASPPPDPTPTPIPTTTPVATAVPSAVPSSTAVPSPSGAAVPISAARALPDGTAVTVEGIALSDSVFSDGGGYIADGTGGIAVLVTDAAFARGELLRVTGELDDRYAQRTIRVSADGLERLGTGSEPSAAAVATGIVGEAVEGQLVQIDGTINGAATALSGGVAFPVDDGSGEVRLLVPTSAAIDTSTWSSGDLVEAVGVVGQRDATGTGTSGYRVQIRDAADLRAITPAPTATPGATESESASPSPSADAGTAISISELRALPKNARATVRGVVTLALNSVEPGTAAIQDASGAIILRLGDEMGELARGSHVEVSGLRSAFGGMETLRLTAPVRVLGPGSEPEPQSVATGEAGEDHEAMLVGVRGGIVASPRRSSAGTVTFEIDDGSGPLRVSLAPSTGIARDGLAAGAWIEVRGILGQETTGSQPLRGYRVWPRAAGDLRVTAPATGSTPGGPGRSAGPGGVGPASPRAGLDAVGSTIDPDLPIGATLVAGPWPELGVGGLLWDGSRLAALHSRAADAVVAVLGTDRPPIAVELVGLRAVGVHEETGIPTVTLGDEPGALVRALGRTSPPTAALPGESGEPAWVLLVGVVRPTGASADLVVAGRAVRIDNRCEGADAPAPGVHAVGGVAPSGGEVLLVPCGGITPAPRLGGAATHSAADEETGTVVAGGSGSTSGGSDTASRSAPAALLGLAALTAAVGGLLVRRLRGTPDDDPDDERSSVIAPSASDDPDVERHGSVPTLTLVTLPHERAP